MSIPSERSARFLETVGIPLSPSATVERRRGWHLDRDPRVRSTAVEVLRPVVSRRGARRRASRGRPDRHEPLRCRENHSEGWRSESCGLGIRPVSPSATTSVRARRSLVDQPPPARLRGGPRATRVEPLPRVRPGPPALRRLPARDELARSSRIPSVEARGEQLRRKQLEVRWGSWSVRDDPPGRRSGWGRRARPSCRRGRGES